MIIDGSCVIDAETAASAVRNLNEYDIGGRQLRVDYAAMDPHPDNQRHQRQHQHPPPRSQPPPPAMPPPQAMPPPHQQHVPPMNAPKPPGPATSVDEISRVLASMNSEQLFVLMSQMKVNHFKIVVQDVGKKKLTFCGSKCPLKDLLSHAISSLQTLK